MKLEGIFIKEMRDIHYSTLCIALYNVTIHIDSLKIFKIRQKIQAFLILQLSDQVEFILKLYSQHTSKLFKHSND